MHSLIILTWKGIALLFPCDCNFILKVDVHGVVSNACYLSCGLFFFAMVALLFKLCITLKLMTLHNLRNLFTVDMHNHGETSVYLLWKFQKSSKLGDSCMKLMPHLSQINKGPPLQVIVIFEISWAFSGFDESNRYVVQLSRIFTYTFMWSDLRH